MKHEDLVFEALAYRRHVGADLDSIRAYVNSRERRKGSTKTDRAALGRLQKAGKTVQVGQMWYLTPTGFKLAKGHSQRPKWLPGDPLILMALHLSAGEQGCGLQSIMGATDYIDRSYPSLEELHGALNRLAAGGLLKRHRGRYLVTDKANGLLDKAKSCCTRGVRNQLRALGRLLHCPCCGVALKKVRWRITLDEATRKEAIKSYLERHRGA